MSSACWQCPIAHTLGPMRRTALTVIALAALAACSGGSDDPPVAVRDVTGVTDPVVETTPDVAAVPEPLDYAIEWTQVSDRTDEGRLTVPVDYADPQGDTIERAALDIAVAQDHPVATLFRAADKSAGVFAPLAPPLLRIHRNLKAAFDPAGVFNPGRLVADL